MTALQDWQPIERAPHDGTRVLLLYPSGRIAIGRWEHVVRTVNGEVKRDHAGWAVQTSYLDYGDALEPIYFATIPPLPPRGEDGYIITETGAPHA